MLLETPNLTHLRLDIEGRISTEQGTELTALLPASFPRLKTLTLFLDIDDVEFQDPWKDFLVTLKNATPSVQQLSLSPANDAQMRPKT